MVDVFVKFIVAFRHVPEVVYVNEATGLGSIVTATSFNVSGVEFPGEVTIQL